MVETNGSTEKPRPGLLSQLGTLAAAFGKGAGTVTLAGIRTAMPVLAAVSGVRIGAEEGDDKEAMLGFSRGQIRVLNTLAAKVALESIEIASVTHPIHSAATPFVAHVDGVRQAPHLMHLLALAAAVQDWLGDDDGDDGAETPGREEVFYWVPPANMRIGYFAAGTGEYAVKTGPATPLEIRRSAMRLRSYDSPQPAMYVLGSDPAMIVASKESGDPRSVHSAMLREGQIVKASKSGVHPAAAAAAADCSSGCGCGGHGGCSCGHDGGCCSGGSGCDCGGTACCSAPSGCACGRCGRGHRFAPARYRDDGTCAPITEISCDTRWRVRDCLKAAIADFVRCLGDEICDDDCRFVEEPDLRRCAEGFVCTFLNCLPDAICPPPKKEPKCLPPRARDCACNFAVGD